MAIAPPQPAGRVPAGTKKEEHTADVFRLMGLMRQVRVDAQNIGATLTAIRTAADVDDATTRAAIAAAAPSIAIDSAQIDGRIVEVDALLNVAPALLDGAGDATERVSNAWQQLKAAVAWPSKVARPDVKERIARVAGLVTEIEFQTALITIPARAEQHLDSMHPGQQLDFDAEFQDEVADADKRLALLSYLHDHPLAVGGVVDVANRVIYRADPRAWRRRLSILGLPLLATVGGYVAVWLLANGIPLLNLSFQPLTGIGSDRFGDLVGTYFLVLLGSIVHIATAAIKQQQSSKPGQFLASQNWALWVHVREISIAVGIVTVWIAFLFLAISFPKDEVTPLMAFATGFSADSVLGLAVTRFDASSKSAVTALGTLVKQTGATT